MRDMVRVLFHLNGGFTKVLHEASEQVALANGGFTTALHESPDVLAVAQRGMQWEISTSIIPDDLRSIGSRFVLVEDASVEQHVPVNSRFAHVRVERLLN